MQRDTTRKSRPGLVAAGILALVAAAVAIWWFSPGQQRKRQVDTLMAAASDGDAREVEAALAAGADVNARDASGITPLMYAARGSNPSIDNPAPTDHPEIVQLLIKHGAQVNMTTRSGFVALFWAARYGHDRVTKVLIDDGVNVNAKDKDGMTALKWANLNNQTRVIALLQAAGATK